MGYGFDYEESKHERDISLLSESLRFVLLILFWMRNSIPWPVHYGINEFTERLKD